MSCLRTFSCLELKFYCELILFPVLSMLKSLVVTNYYFTSKRLGVPLFFMICARNFIWEFIIV